MERGDGSFPDLVRIEMKARQLAIAPGSVYALTPSGEVHSIERGEEGLWGGWRDAGGRAKSIVHAGAVVGAIGFDGRVAALQRNPAMPWHTWDLEASELAAARLADGTPTLFALAADGEVQYTWKSSPATPWGPWQPLGGSVTDIAASVIPGGGLVVFGIGEGAVYHKWQDQPGSSWHGWTAIGSPPGGARTLDVTTIAGGGLVVFARAADGTLHHRWQDKPFAPWREWVGLGGPVGDFSVCKSAGGGLAVFAVGPTGETRYRHQVKPFGEWSDWADLHGYASRIAGQAGYVDGLEAFAIDPAGEVRHKWCDRLDVPWTDWVTLDHETSPFRS